MKSIFKKKGKEPGKTLAVFCGTHGNEKAGVLAVKKILKTIKIRRGVVYFIFANPKAIKKNVRLTEKNLNRCFKKDQKGRSYEEKRARKLMKILDKTDALLDVHSSNNPQTTPFVITGNGFDIVKNMNFEIVATGFDNFEAGSTDDYMKRNNRIGICIECGYSGESEKNKNLAYNSILQFLQYYDIIDKGIENDGVKQKFVHIDGVQLVTSENFKMAKSFADFETVPRGTLLAMDGEKKFIAKEEKVIIFGSIQKHPVGAEAYVLGNWVKK